MLKLKRKSLKLKKHITDHYKNSGFGLQRRLLSVKFQAFDQNVTKNKHSPETFQGTHLDSKNVYH